VALVAGSLEGVVERAKDFGGFDVGRVLVAEDALFNAGDESEMLDVAREVAKRKADLGAGVEVVKFELLKVADEEIAGEFVVFELGKVVESLFFGFREVAASALLLYEEHAFPEKVDEAAAVAEALDGFFVTGDAAAAGAEDLEKLVVERLRLAALVVGVFPISGELGGLRANLGPAEAHTQAMVFVGARFL